MWQKRNFWSRAVPIFVFVAVTIILSLIIYHTMISKERESSWERLDIATRSTASKIQVRLDDNLNFLEAVSDAYILTHNLDKEERVMDYLRSVTEKTIFETISVILPDGYMMTSSGKKVMQDEDFDYKELLKKGTHLSARSLDPFTGKEVIYCYTPINSEEGNQGLLCGGIDCRTLGNLFQVFTYGNDAQMFLIDCADGNYLIDNWHKELGNVFSLGLRKSIDGKGWVNLATPVMRKEYGRVAYISETNGLNSYQTHTPVPGYNWELLVVVQEDVVFKHVYTLRNLLLSVGVVELFLLVVYVGWNLWLATAVTKSEEKTQKLELEKATNAAKAQFISSMSHDIRTPLNGIVGMLQIIRNHRDDESMVDECLDKIEVSTQYLATLASDMLDINEIENNQLILEEESIDLKCMADELTVLVAQKAQENQVEFHMDYSEVQHPYVLGSVVHIKRILANLIGNAIKYSKDSGRQVWVKIEEAGVEDDLGQYCFIVKDNGVGMTEEFQQNMYNAFAQEKISARSTYQGYGLGLTIVNRLVKKMKGTIELESEKWMGSTFKVTLPLKIDQSGKKQSVEVENVDLKGMHILLVEDNEFNMEIAKVLLEDVGVQITTAINGRLATEVFAETEENTFDLILMDIMMPELDGCEAARVIRQMPRLDAKTIPIIAMSASAFSDEINRCKEVGMDEHVAKPLDMGKLLTCIAKYHRGKQKHNKELR